MGVLSGWDRVFIHGTQRALANVAGMMSYLSYVGVLLKDFGVFVEETSERIKQASEEAAQRLNRPVIFLKTCHVSKEELAQKIALQDGISEGLICILRCVEPGISYRIYSNRQQKKLTLKREPRQCLHYYHYWMDPDFGLMHARLQTWFPFDIQVCFNGRSWLARQMDKKSLGYEKRENCFAWLENVPATQKLMDRLLKLNWPRFLGGIASQIIPLQKQILQGYRTDYYWSIYESEWATDIMFRSMRALDQIYPSLIRGAISAFSTRNVMRFLGKKPQGPYRTGEVISSYLRRPEGIRVKHSINRNSVKLYNKQGSVLRVETTINDPYEFKAFRPKENDPEGDYDWRYLRKGIADIHRRAVCRRRCPVGLVRSCVWHCSVDRSRLSPQSGRQTRCPHRDPYPPLRIPRSCRPHLGRDVSRHRDTKSGRGQTARSGTTPAAVPRISDTGLGRDPRSCTAHWDR